MPRIVAALAVLAALVIPGPASALGPQEVAVIYNQNLPASKQVAEYYCQRRGVPIANLIALDVADVTEISRADYESRILAPVRAALKDRRASIRVLLTVYGVPLRVGDQAISEADKAAIEKIKPEVQAATEEVQKLTRRVRFLKDDLEKDPGSPEAAALSEREAQLKAAKRKVVVLEERVRILTHWESTAAVDSELMLLWWPPYELSRWVINPLYWQFPESLRRRSPPVMMTARLDGPNAEVAKRLVDDALAAEKTGLAGKVYIDARGIKYDPKADPGGTQYGGYDESFREAARLLDVTGKMDVTLENTEELFPAGSCTNCAMYCGWYALRNYRPCCRFVRGAIAWHLASLEMTNLRNPGKEWAGNLLRDGAAVTIGPVGEPYTVGFPRPEEFFGFIVTGEYTIVEAYSRSLMLTSWMVALVGDPLYNPYAKTPKLKSSDVWASPISAARVFRP
jgi:uncharacterized protein (TIGR03790 family)